MAYTRSYTYLRVTFTGPRFSLHEVACARLSRGYAALGSLERQCAHIQFQEPRTKLWLFDTLVAPTLLYGVEIWGPSSYKVHKWTDLERPLVLMIGRVIRRKAFVPHDTVWVEMGAAPIAIEALLRSVTNIQRLWKLPKKRYPILALYTSLKCSGKNITVFPSPRTILSRTSSKRREITIKERHLNVRNSLPMCTMLLSI